MPSYAYNDGDGLSVIDKTLPNGATEPVSSLDDALKQVKAWMKDATAGGAYIKAEIETAKTDITTLEAADVAMDTRMDTAETDIAALETDVGVLQNTVDGLVAAGGSAPVTAIIITGSTQAVAAGAGATTVQFNTASLDTRGGFNVGTYTYTAPIAGLYNLVVALGLTTTAASTPTAIVHTLEVFVNGTSAAKTVLAVDSDDDRTIELARMFQLSATNTVLVKYTCAVGSGSMTSTIQADPTKTILQLSRPTT